MDSASLESLMQRERANEAAGTKDAEPRCPRVRDRESRRFDALVHRDRSRLRLTEARRVEEATDRPAPEQQLRGNESELRTTDVRELTPTAARNHTHACSQRVGVHR